MNDPFDFDTPMDRKNSDSAKWQKFKDRDIIPMWVADMDFQSPPAVMAALHQRIDHGVFGYAMPDKGLYEAITIHLHSLYHWRIEPDWIVWLPGLVTGINVACRCVGSSGGGVLTTVPVYPPFLKAPKLSGKKLIPSPMVFDERHWHIDFEDLKKGRDVPTAMFLLCNPHNPTGRMFTHRELETLAEICLSRRWILCSDEIHCDLIMDPERTHLPIAALDSTIGKHTITLMAPSKTYNIPGLSCSFAVIADPKLRRRFAKCMAGIVPHVNLLGFVAARAAYDHGQPWLEAVLRYLRGNLQLVYQAIEQIPGLVMGPVEATYLAWIDTRPTGIENPVQFFESAGIGLSDGADFGAPGFVRLNFACARSVLKEALSRIAVSLPPMKRLTMHAGSSTKPHCP